MMSAPYPDRTQWLNGDQPLSKGQYVICWLHHALRCDHNAVLDTASVYADELNLPLLIYAGLGGNHRFNSDRSHRFILESARDLHARLQKAGQSLCFNPPTDPATPGPLPALARKATLIVSEQFPVAPLPAWHHGLKQRAPDTPFILADDHCVVPHDQTTPDPLLFQVTGCIALV